MINKFSAIKLFFTLVLVVAASGILHTHIQAATFTITINSGTNTGAIKYGGIGWLYGLGENNYILDSKITALVHPGYSGQKAPWGAQHAYGDALNVAVQAKRVGLKGIDIYVQDFYAPWPYPNNGIDSYINNVVNRVIDSVKADPNRTFVRYVPFNEPDWIWYAPTGSKLTQFLNDWKRVYDVIKTRDGSGAKIIGPGFMRYHAGAYDAFISFCKTNNCLPDVITWHELEDAFFTQYYNNYNSYRSIESKYSISQKEVYINEYGRQNLDIPRPGKLIQYLARFEKTKVWAAMAFWTGGNKLDDLLTDEGFQQGRETGAYWLYQWYGQMTGNTVDVALPSVNGPLQAIATKSATNTVKVIFGGSAGDSDVNTINVAVNGLSSGSVQYDIYETNYTTGFHAKPGIRSSGTATVSNGQVTIPVSNAKALSAYLVNIYPGGSGTVSVNDNTTGTGQNQFNFTGSWSYGSQSGAFQTDNHWSSVANNVYQVAFTGRQVRIYSARNNNHGIFAVSIDGGSETNIDLYSATRSDQVLVWTSPMLASGSHTVRVRVTGTKNASSSSAAVVADRVDIVQ